VSGFFFGIITDSMSVKTSLSESGQIFKQSAKVLRKYPVLIVPLLCSWVVFAAVVLLWRYNELPISLAFWSIFLLAYSIAMACLMQLELIYQIESGKKPLLRHALREFISKDAVRVFPVAFVWAVIWFVILILRALSNKDNSKKTPEPSLADAGRTLSGISGTFSWAGLGLSVLEKMIRMTVFSILPAIAWEGKGPLKATRKGLSVVRKHPVQFLANYGLTGLAAAIMILPLVPVGLLDQAGVSLPGAVWVAIIIYAGIVWTVEMYLEQMTVALLYLWHVKWESAGSKGELSAVTLPHMLDDVAEFNQLAQAKSQTSS
jgi:hypothetical protein